MGGLATNSNGLLITLRCRSFRQITVVIAFLCLSATAYFVHDLGKTSSGRIVYRPAAGYQPDRPIRPPAVRKSDGAFGLEGIVLAQPVLAAAFGVVRNHRRREMVCGFAPHGHRVLEPGGGVHYAGAHHRAAASGAGDKLGLVCAAGRITEPKVVLGLWQSKLLIAILPALIIAHWLGLTLRLIKRATGAGVVRLSSVAIVMLASWVRWQREFLRASRGFDISDSTFSHGAEVGAVAGVAALKLAKSHFPGPPLIGSSGIFWRY